MLSVGVDDFGVSDRTWPVSTAISDGTILYGLQGNDTFEVLNGVENVFLLGGRGFDSYSIDGRNTTVTILDGSANHNEIDDIFINGIGWNWPTSRHITINNTHFVTFDTSTGQTVIIANAFNAQNSNDWVWFADEVFTLSDLRNESGFPPDGNYSWAAADNYLAGFGVELLEPGQTGAEFEEAIAFYNQRSSMLESNYSGNGLFVGDGFGQYLFGGPGNDTMNGLGSRDSLFGGTGNDVLSGGQGNDYLDGDAGNDTLTGGSGDDDLLGSAGADILNGGSGLDELYAGGGNDVLIGGGDNDYLDGGANSDLVDYSSTTGGVTVNLATGSASGSGIGNDTLFAIEQIAGGSGNDDLTGSSGDNTLIGGAGADTLTGGSGIDSASYINAASAVLLDLTNSANNTGDAAGDVYNSIERFIGSSFSDTIIGSVGSDTVDGQRGFDILSYTESGAGLIAILETAYKIYNSGDAALDTYTGVEGIIGTGSNDFLGGDNNLNGLVGAAGNDTLVGLGGVDYLIGGSGDDTLNGGDGADWLFGDGDTDTASYLLLAAGGLTASLANPGSNTGHAAGDRYFSIENLEGTNRADSLQGDNNANHISGVGGRDTLVGFGGNDTLDGGARADELNGGAGFDYASYDSSNTGLTAVLLSGFTNLNTGHADGDSYTSIEGLIGTSQNDLLAGDNNANELIGGDGDDELIGLNGNDTLDGGAGNDTLNGGYPFNPNGFGDDRFVFATGYDQDTITGFAAGAGSDDVIALSLGTDFDTFGEVQSAASDVGGNTLLTFNGGDSLTLIGVTSASLHNDDFVFV